MPDDYELIGIKRTDYVRKSDNKRILGWNLYFSFDDENITGLGCADHYVNDDVFNNFSFSPQLGKRYRLYFNQWKRLIDVHEVA